MSAAEGTPPEPLVSAGHPDLFHYTTESGLYGILESQCLWATHYAYLNDSQELTAARGPLLAALHNTVREVAEKLIQEKKIRLNEGVTLDQLAHAEADNTLDIYYRVALKYVSPYIFSFCSHSQNEDAFSDGLLSQWRGYGKSGGFAIQFETQALEGLLEQDEALNVHSTFAMSEVLYGESSKDFHFAAEDIKAVASIATLVIPWGLGFASEPPNLNHLQGPFAKVVTRIKNPGFAEEREVRLVYVRPDDSTIPEGRLPAKPIEFRSHAGCWIPYVRLFAPPEMRLPIRRIIVGPHPRADLRKRTLELFLSHRRIEATVDLSKIPYLPES